MLWKGTLGGEVFAPVRLLSHFSPWRTLLAASEAIPWDVLLWDGVAQFYQWREVSNRLLRAGELPLWNPYALCGTPLLANSQSAPLYPVHLLTCWIPTARLMGWLAWFHVFWAALGMGLFLQRIGLNRWGSLLGVACWALSAFFTCWLQLTSVPATLSWFPWLLLGVQNTVERGLRGVWLLGLTGGMMLLAGHLQFAFYGFLLGLAYAIFLIIGIREGLTPSPLEGEVGRGGKHPLGIKAKSVRLASSLLGFLIAFLVAAVQLLPTLEFAGLSHRASVPLEAGYEAYVRNALPPLQLLTYGFPDAFGNPRVGNYWGYGHYAEFALYVGLGALIWSVYALLRARNRILWFWLGVWGVALLLALGTPLNRLFYFYLPGFSSTGSPARVLCLAVFALSVLAACGFDRFTRSAFEFQVSGFKFQVSSERMPFLMAVGLALLLNGLLLAMGFWLLPVEVPVSQLWAGVQSSLPRWGGFFLATSLIGWLLTENRLRPALALTLLLTLGVLDPFVQAYGYNPTAPLSVAFPPVPALSGLSLQAGERIAALNTRWSLFEPPPATLPPNTATAYGVHDVAGYDSLAPRPIKRFLDWLNGKDSAPPENGNMFFVKQADPRLRWLRVEQILVGEHWETLPPIAGSGLYLAPAEYEPDENRLWARLADTWENGRVLLQGPEAADALKKYGSVSEPMPGATVHLTSYGATRIEVRVHHPANQTAWLFLSDTWYPGWRAWVDGQEVPVLLANGAFRALPVPPGDHQVLMRFMPTRFRIGLIGSGIGFVILSGLWLWSRFNYFPLKMVNG